MPSLPPSCSSESQSTLTSPCLGSNCRETVLHCDIESSDFIQHCDLLTILHCVIESSDFIQHCDLLTILHCVIASSDFIQHCDLLTILHCAIESSDSIQHCDLLTILHCVIESSDFIQQCDLLTITVYTSTPPLIKLRQYCTQCTVLLSQMTLFSTMIC